jgi:putative membrane-bound dehydrogenase-like protein
MPVVSLIPMMIFRVFPMAVLAAAGWALTTGTGTPGRAEAAAAADPPRPPATFRAGAVAVDIAPPKFPVRVNGMFTERTADRIVDPLRAKALVLDDGTTRLALCVVDTCMMDRALIDAAKEEAARLTGLPTDRMLVSATHTHSAPSAMGCLGSRQDPEYAAFLPGRIAEAIAGAVAALQPARIGWTAVDAWDHTFNRRWIRRPDRVLNDPFGQPSVRANMHPGHQSEDVTGPSGPVDPQLSLLAVQTPDGRPLAVLANYSMHYISSDLLSSDYFGRFADHLAAGLGADAGFVGMMSQGTSGDLWAGDYGAPARPLHYDTYAREMTGLALAALKSIEWHDTAPLKMAERTLRLDYRVPDEARLAWAQAISAERGERLPESPAEIYAAEAIHLHERRRTELKLQALSIGGLGVTALPNEVVAITGLKLKAQSPLTLTMNIELANGADGYIPPPEQHHLGGYITWPARTAGLEVTAEPKIVETTLRLLEEVAGQPRRSVVVSQGPYAEAVRAADPLAYWRLDDIVWPVARDSGKSGLDATMEPGVAVYLPGAGSGSGISPQAALTPSAFSGPSGINRAVHLAGGRVRATAALGDTYSAELWIWNGLPADARAVTGYLFSRGPDGDPTARGEHLGLGGTHRADLTGRLFLFNGNERDEIAAGRTVLAPKAWHHIVFVRDGARVRVHLDGNPVPEIDTPFAHTAPPGESSVFFGGRNDALFGLEGRLDEIALYPRALSPEEIAAHYRASGQAPPVTAATLTPAAPQVVPPLTPAESLARMHVPDGYAVELAAAEPLVLDPVAIDWDPAGRLWVVEMADYPLGLDGQGRSGGRVRVLEDTDGDGRCDRSTLFADGLNFPTGLLTWRDGVIVTVAPDIVFLRDTDGDGQADTREVLVSGLLEGNQQLRANGLRWGLDNWVHCAAGGHHGDYGVGNALRSTRTGESVTIGSRDFRFRPDTGALEPQSGPSQFGRNRDDWGHWFGTQNSRPLWHYVLADHYLRRNPHIAAPDPSRQIVVPLNPKVWPVSPQEKRYHSFENSGHFTSACSGMIYRDSLLFPATERHAFTCEPFHNLVQHNILTEDGVSFGFRRAPDEETRDFFASEDRWCRPVMTRTGPDGALWVVDMYRYIIEHPDWLPPDGRTELLPYYRLGDDRGRLYRIVAKNTTARPVPRLDQLDTPALVAALDSPNEWQRDTAHRLLLWRAEATATDPLIALARNSRNPLARLHALCVLDGLNALTPDVLGPALDDPHPGVRANALRLAETRGTPAIIAAAVALTGDPDPKVRLQLACTLGEWEAAAAGTALGKLAVAHHDDTFMTAAVMSSAMPHVRSLATAAAAAGTSARDALAPPLATLALALNDRAALATLLAPALATDADGRLTGPQLTALAGFLDTLARHHQPIDSLAAGTDALARLLARIDAATAAARAAAAGESTPLDHRTAAVTVLLRLPAEHAQTMSLLQGWLAPGRPAEMTRAAITALAATGDDSVPATLLAGWASYSPALRDAVFDALLTREAWTTTLLTSDLDGSPPATDATRRARLLTHPSPAIRTLAETRLTPASPRTDVIARFQPALDLPGDPARGRAVHTRLCASCHRLDQTGLDVGPNLQSVASHPPEKLLTNILAPNVDVQPGYHAYLCRLSDGTDLYGLITSETGNSLTFKSADGTSRTILRRDIVSLRSSTLSLMPEGLEAGLSLQDMADLIASLRHPDSPPPASPDNAR